MRRPREVIRLLLPCYVAFVLLAGLLSSAFGYNPNVGGLDENRRKSPAPVFRGHDIAAFVEQWDAYYADNYGFREFLIHVNSVLRNRLLRANDSENVILDYFDLS
jgi:hypothetical protein